jgi:hypothetical protein
MTDRDTFAAAALTGLLCNGDYNTDSIPSLAYSMADAMLCKRERVTRPLPKEKRAEVSFTLTAEEREAVQFFADIHWDDDPPHEYAATLRAMLKRLA